MIVVLVLLIFIIVGLIWFTSKMDNNIESAFTPAGKLTPVSGGIIHWQKQGNGPALILIHGSSLPERLKEKLLQLNDKRVTNEGVFVLKAQNYRTQEQNREDALARLVAWIKAATIEQKPRIKTKVSRAAKARRVDVKKQQGVKKSMRKKVEF